MKKMYMVKYYGGSYDDFRKVDIFVTDKKSKATKYVTKFNKILKKWKEHYKQFEADDLHYSWIADEYVDKHFVRWNSLRDITKCYWKEIELR